MKIGEMKTIVFVKKMPLAKCQLQCATISFNFRDIRMFICFIRCTATTIKGIKKTNSFRCLFVIATADCAL